MFHRQQQESEDTAKKEQETQAQSTVKGEEKAMVEKKDTVEESVKESSKTTEAVGGPSFPRAMPGQAVRGGSFSGYNPSSVATAPTAATASGNGRRLVIGEGITMSGEIESCDILVVEGTVEAALKGARIMEVAESGVFYGTVEIVDATIAGCFEGDIVATGRLTVTSTGSVTGSISYQELSVEAGATVDGSMVPLSAKAAGKKTDKKGGKVIKSAGPKNDNAGELFPEKKVAVGE